jgi:hypothetical protein
MTKWSRLVRKILGPGFKCHLNPGPKKRPRDDHLKTGRSGFLMLTVFVKIHFLLLKWPRLVYSFNHLNTSLDLN